MEAWPIGGVTIKQHPVWRQPSGFSVRTDCFKDFLIFLHGGNFWDDDICTYMRKEIEMTLTYCFTEWFRFILDSAKHKLSDTSWCHALVLAVIAQQKATANGVLCPPISDLTTAQTPRSPVRNSYKSKHFVGWNKEASPSISIRRSECLSKLGWTWFPMISTQQKTTWKMLWPGKHCFFLLCKVVLAERSSQSVLELLVQSVFVCFGGLLKAGPHRSFGYLRPINILSFSCLVERSCKKVIESFQFQVVFFWHLP